MTAPIIPGAEPWSADGTNGHGALVLHGFTGNCNSMRGLAEAFHAAGYSVELPLLPGHGTAIEDMLVTGWADWSAAAEEAYQRRERGCGTFQRTVTLPFEVEGDQIKARKLFEELRAEEKQHQEYVKKAMATLPPGPDVEEDEADEPGSDAG